MCSSDLRNFAPGAFEAIHASATALAQAGALDKATVRHFDDLCFVVVPQLDAKRTTSGIENLRGVQSGLRSTFEP